MAVFLIQGKINPGTCTRPGHVNACLDAAAATSVAVPFLIVFMLLRAFPPLRTQSFSQFPRTFRTTSTRNDFHFDTHHFVQRLEREGLNRAQAEGIMSAMAEVIDESIRNMTSNMVTKADHEKVLVSRHHHARLPTGGRSNNTRSRLTLPNSNPSSS